ncbi:MAG: NAD-dependent epimerase/dehydratase family protein [Gemmatimonadetes bacterium]|nr:NAD-dependent epimerase/dehydratase family protein [Gemmatimonadota bacterium]
MASVVPSDATASTSPGPALVTGAAGFVGGRLALRLRERGTQVRALVRPTHVVPELEAAGVEISRGDAGDREVVAKASDGCRIVYHLAAARGRHKLDYRAFMKENRRISEAVGEGALQAGVERVVFTSTVSVAGWRRSEPHTESTSVRPNSAYCASRLQDEQIFREFGGRGLDVVTVRLPQQIMGPGAYAWARVARRLAAGWYRVVPDGGTIQPADVADLIDGMMLCASRPGIAGELFVLGGPSEVSLFEVLGTLAECLGVPFAPRIVPGALLRAYVRLGNVAFDLTRLSLPHHFTAEFLSVARPVDWAKAERELGFRPRFAMPQSMARTVEWLRDQDLV